MPPTDSSESQSFPAPPVGSSRSEKAVSSKGRWLAFVAWSLLGGLVGGMVLEKTHNLSPAERPPETANARGVLTPELQALVDASTLRADKRNFPVALGLLGAFVAGHVGFACGLERGTAGRGLAVGAVGGLVLGAAGGFAAVMVREALRSWNTLDATGAPDPLKSALYSLAIHLPTWIGVALAVAAAAAVATRDGSRFVPVAGMATAGAILAGVLFPIFVSMVFPLDDAVGVVPVGAGSRYAWSLINSALIGLIVGHALTQPAKSGQTPKTD